MAGESCAARQSVIECHAAMSIEDKLTELGITLPEAPAAVAAYQPWIRTGNLIFTSGQLPWRDGEIAFAGKLGAEVSDEDGYQAARQCALNAIAQLKAASGDLEKVRKIVRIEGYVHCAEGFRSHPQVLNGAGCGERNFWRTRPTHPPRVGHQRDAAGRRRAVGDDGRSCRLTFISPPRFREAISLWRPRRA